MTAWTVLKRLLPWTRATEPAPQKDNPPLETPVPDPRASCPACRGSLTVTAKDEQGADIQVPCPRCLPNDALGG